MLPERQLKKTPYTRRAAECPTSDPWSVASSKLALARASIFLIVSFHVHWHDHPIAFPGLSGMEWSDFTAHVGDG